MNIRIPSLYNHIKNVEDLEWAMTAWGLKQLTNHLRQAAVGTTGPAAVRAMAQAYRSFMNHNPGLLPIVNRTPAADDKKSTAYSRELVELLLLVMGSLGLEGDQALHAFRGLRSLLHGFVTIESQNGFQLDLDVDQSFQLMIDVFIREFGSSAASD